MRLARLLPLPPAPEHGGLTVDLFAGPGGWSTGLRALGLHDIGIEWDPAACRTRVTEGHLTIKGDVSQVPTAPFRGRTWLLIASPPCQSWSLAGKQGGKPTAFLDALAGRYDDAYIARMRVDIRAQQAAYAAWSAAWAGVAGTRGWWADPAAAASDEVAGEPVAYLVGHDDDGRAAGGGPVAVDAGAAVDAVLMSSVTGTRLTRKGAKARDAEFGPEPQVDDERGMFMAEVVRWIEGVGFPVHIALEQVPPVLPMWRLLASWLRDRGYSVWAGELNAANYGVPQTRKRAILLARRDGVPVSPPVASHARAAGESEDLFGSVSEPWVSMAQALGWVPGDRATGTTGETVPGRPAGAAGDREADGWVVRTGSNSMSSSRDPMDMVPYERSVGEPAPTLDTQVGSKWQVGPPGSFKAAPHRWKHRPADPDGPDTDGTFLADADVPEALDVLGVPAVSGKGRWEYVASEMTRAARRDPLSEPAPTMAFGKAWMDARYEWVPADPADPDPDVDPQGKPLLSPETGLPETDAPGLPDRRAGAGGQVRHSIKITRAEAAVLQSYPADYRWWGSKSKQFEQIGNSVPPMLGHACIEAVTGRQGSFGWAAAIVSRPSDREVLARYDALPEDVRVLLVPPAGATGTDGDSARAS